MIKFSRRWLFTGLLLMIVAAVMFVFIQNSQNGGSSDAPVLAKTFDKSPTGFTFNYPADWDYTIPMQGLLMTGKPETLFENQPGPTLTVQRATPLSIPGTLDNAIKSYLELGPMRVQGQWKQIGEIQTLTFDGRDARRVELEGSDNANSPLTHVQLIATAADNSFVYMIITTVPVETREVHTPVLDAVLVSLQILE